jgi:hypothetical protein
MQTRDGRMILRALLGASLTLSLLHAPYVAEAQPTKVPRIGIMTTAAADPAVDSSRVLEPLREGLRQNGYVEGQNIVTEFRTGGRGNTLLDVATELVRLKVDVIVATGTPAARAAQQATRTIPIVAYVGDSVEMGLVADLAKPSGNLTGISAQIAETAGKRLELLLEAIPRTSRVAVLWNASNSQQGARMERDPDRRASSRGDTPVRGGAHGRRSPGRLFRDHQGPRSRADPFHGGDHRHASKADRGLRDEEPAPDDRGVQGVPGGRGSHELRSQSA